ncbi:DUF397 domain-containing protein [Kitasatospora sp. NPDC058032]|uniref:DUF397 domain-containing protein n=1 Tax=Kitasatospora sp. NPDC058032 TaxID=3346307 RepID=UPI0036DB7072
MIAVADYWNGMPAGSIDATWIKSAVSAPSGQCVELAATGNREFAIRNSRDPQGPALLFTPAEIRAFVQGAKAGEFDQMIEV